MSLPDELGIDDLLRSALAAETRLSAESSDDSLHVAHPDSGCSGSCTNKKENLVNVRPCHETYVSASGETATATLIGDLPVRSHPRRVTSTSSRGGASRRERVETL